MSDLRPDEIIQGDLLSKSDFEPSTELSGGKQLGPYRLVSALGKGGMATVYRARDTAAGREVALKILRCPYPDSIKRFLREAQVTAALRHPGIVRVHAAGSEEEHVWIAFELVEGAQTLNQVLSRLTQVDIVRLIQQAAEALGHAHEQGIVHRDVKPENILIDAEGRVRVADFGIAGGMGLDRLTRTGVVMGTPCYMAPEQFDGKQPRHLPQTDVWALGVVLYQAVSGRLPFDHRYGLVELAAAILGFDPPPLPRATPALSAVVSRALAKEPGDRYADGLAFARALEGSLAEEGSPRRRSRYLLGVLGLAALLCGAALASRSGPEPAKPAQPTVVASVTPRETLELDDALPWRPGRKLQDFEQVQEIHAWLLTHRDHPAAARARDLIRDQLAVRPVLVVEADRVVWVGSDLVMSRQRSIDLFRCTVAGEESRYAKLPGSSGTLASFSGGQILVGGVGYLQVVGQPPRPWGSKVRATPAPGGELAAVLGRDETLALVDLKSGEVIRRLGGLPSPRLMTFSPDGSQLVTVSGEAPVGSRGEERIGVNWIRVWSVSDGELIAEAHESWYIRTIAVSPSGDSVALGCDSGLLFLYDMPPRELKHGKALIRQLLPGELGLDAGAHHSSVRAVAWRGANRIFSAAGGETSGLPRDMREWDITTGEQLRVVPIKFSPRELLFREDGRYLLCRSPKQVTVWCLELP